MGQVGYSDLLQLLFTLAQILFFRVVHCYIALEQAQQISGDLVSPLPYSSINSNGPTLSVTYCTLTVHCTRPSTGAALSNPQGFYGHTLAQCTTLRNRILVIVCTLGLFKKHVIISFNTLRVFCWIMPPEEGNVKSLLCTIYLGNPGKVCHKL